VTNLRPISAVGAKLCRPGNRHHLQVSGLLRISGHVPPNWLAIIGRKHRARLADD
jgi:hypothetical protein